MATHPSPAFTKSVSIKLFDQAIQFEYPDIGNTWEELTKVLRGSEYPSIPLPNFLPTTIIDVGAHVGASALCFLKRYPQATIHCFEPCALNYQYLERNTQSFSNIHTYNIGLYDQDREARLYTGTMQTMQNSITQSSETSDLFEVIQLRRASKLLESQHISEISILKIDTEGCEIPILKEIHPLLSKTGIIYLEYHSESDRLELEQILKDQFSLCSASSSSLHRGTNTYLSHTLIREYSMGQLEISQPTFD